MKLFCGKEKQMPKIIEVDDLTIPALIPYSTTAEIQLLRYYEPEPGIFIAESPKVIRRALTAGYEPMSFLMEKKYISGQAADIIEQYHDIPVYTAPSDVLTGITGFKLTQGALCAMRRKKLPTVEKVLKGASRVAVLEDIMNQTNVGAIFRSAAALGVDAVLLTKPCSDPLYRRSVRVSMGTVFQIPWTFFDEENYVAQLQSYGFECAAMALEDDSVPPDHPALQNKDKLAIILGTEGTGLRQETIQACDHTVMIPMYHGVDSLNVAAASAVIFWQLRKM